MHGFTSGVARDVTRLIDTSTANLAVHRRCERHAGSQSDGCQSAVAWNHPGPPGCGAECNYRRKLLTILLVRIVGVGMTSTVLARDYMSIKFKLSGPIPCNIEL
jgi:hypothetical protein